MTNVLVMGYAAAATALSTCPMDGPVPLEPCLLRPFRSVPADRSATFASLRTMLSSHRALARVSLATLSFAFVVAMSQQAAPTTQAGPEQAPTVPESLLPQAVGIGVPSDEPITIPFSSPMDAASVESTLQVVPMQSYDLAWNADNTLLTIEPDHLWRTDERYLVVVAASARAADGEALTTARRFTFSTETAPAVTDFQVRLADAQAEADAVVDTESNATLSIDPVPAGDPGAQPPTKTAVDVSATSAITISFSRPMDRADVESTFSIAPEAGGTLSWNDGGDLVFSPSQRLEPGSRYTINLAGAHDAAGNVLGGKANFSFVVQSGAQVTKTVPEKAAADVEPATVEIWFSQPMNVEATNKAFSLKDTSTGALVGGFLNWNEASTQLVYAPDTAFAGGRAFEVSLGDGARDADGNTVTTSFTFTTTMAPATVPVATAATTRSAPSAPGAPPPAAAPAPAPVVPPPAPATSLAGHALNQVNAARAAYGFPPVVLDGSISAVASAHASDQAYNNYFSHYSLDGRSREDRLRAGGVSFSWSGENQCYHIGMSQGATLDWCHAQFMAEPYPGQWNHIANILNPNARRMGVGIATVGSKTIITWNFAN